MSAMSSYISTQVPHDPQYDTIVIVFHLRQKWPRRVGGFVDVCVPSAFKGIPPASLSFLALIYHRIARSPLLFP